MSNRFELARQVTLEQLSEVYGHETAHLDRGEQFRIACEAITMFAKICQDINEEQRSETETGSTK